jgi:uncharacterized protein YjiS (DUF1127 family)
MVLITQYIEKDLIIMSAPPAVGKASPSLLLLRPRRSALTMLLAWLIRLLYRHDSLDDLKALTDAQLRDIGIERHRIGPSIDRDRDRCPSW